MYQEYYGLSEKPFSLTPDPRFLYLSKKHKEAFAHLMYGIQSRSGFVMVSGEIGTGKTTICRSLLKQLDPSIEVALIFNPYLSPEELLKHVNREFGIESDSTSVLDLIAELNVYLLESASLGKTCVLIIDEAQNLSAEVLEQIRLLSNLETEKEKLIQIMLIGQPELAEKLELHELRQLNQRITARYHLEALTEEETLHYVAFRLRVAGGRKMVRFTRKSIREIYKISQGTPRVINATCDRALLIGFTQETREITPKIIKAAAHEIQGDGHIQRRTLNLIPLFRTAGVFSFAAVVVLAIILLASGPLPFSSPRTANSTDTPEQTTTYPVSGRDQQVEAIVKPLPINTIELPRQKDPVVTEVIDSILEIPEEVPAPVLNPDTLSVLEEAPAPTIIASVPDATTTLPTPKDLLPAPAQTLPSLHAIVSDLLSAWEVQPQTPLKSTDINDIRAFGLAHDFSVSLIPSPPRALLNVNFPVLIELNSEGTPHWAAWLSSHEDSATLSLGENDTQVTMTLDELEANYAGRTLVFWRDERPYTNTLHVDEQGEAVWSMQDDLVALGLRKSEANGVYDSETVKMVKRIQELCGIDVDGLLGEHTRMVLSAWLDTQSPHLWTDEYPYALPVALRTKKFPAPAPIDTARAEVEPDVPAAETPSYTPLIAPQQTSTDESVTEPARTVSPLRPVAEDEVTKEPST